MHSFSPCQEKNGGTKTFLIQYLFLIFAERNPTCEETYSERRTFIFFMVFSDSVATFFNLF